VSILVTNADVTATDGPAVGIVLGAELPRGTTNVSARNVTVVARNSSLNSTSRRGGAVSSVLGITWGGTVVVLSIGIAGWPCKTLNLAVTGNNVFSLQDSVASATEEPRAVRLVRRLHCGRGRGNASQ
jgi:hypothetical protein